MILVFAVVAGGDDVCDYLLLVLALLLICCCFCCWCW